LSSLMRSKICARTPQSIVAGAWRAAQPERVRGEDGERRPRIAAKDAPTRCVTFGSFDVCAFDAPSHDNLHRVLPIRPMLHIAGRGSFNDFWIALPPSRSLARAANTDGFDLPIS
jgi:hypothetical protein